MFEISSYLNSTSRLQKRFDNEKIVIISSDYIKNHLNQGLLISCESTGRVDQKRCLPYTYGAGFNNSSQSNLLLNSKRSF